MAYQYDNNNVITPVNWTADYLANNGSGVVGFNFETYDTTKPLVLLIGPPPAGGSTPFTDGVCWSTYFGGTDWDNVNDLAVDHQGNQYVTGSTRSAFATFPNTLGNVYWASIQTMFQHNSDRTTNCIGQIFSVAQVVTKQATAWRYGMVRSLKCSWVE